MEHALTIAVLAGIGGMFGWGLADFFAKKTIDAIGDVVTLVWAHIFGTLILGFVFLYQVVNGNPFTTPADTITWVLLVLLGILQAAVYLLVYRGFGKGQVALLNPVFSSFTGIVALVSVFVLGEALHGGLLVALAVIFIGILMLSLDVDAIRSGRVNFAHIPGLVEVLLATLLATAWTLLWNEFVGGADWVSYALFMYVFMTIAMFAYARALGVALFPVAPGLWKFLVLIGACEVIAYLAISWGYSSTTYTSVVALVSGAFSLPTIILARIFLKERTARIQTIGTLVIIAGVLMVSLL